MKNLRKEDLSLHCYVKDHVLPRNYVEFEEFVPLSFMSGISTDTSFVYEALTEMIPSPTSPGRGWVYFDEGFSLVSGTMEQINRVTVYSGSEVNGVLDLGVIPDTEYIIDYVDGRIVTSGTCDPTYVSYYWNYVSVVDEWDHVRAAEPPIMAIDVKPNLKGGYQLGGGIKNSRLVTIHIFASSKAERDDLVEYMYDAFYLNSCFYYDFPDGTILDFDGTFYGRKEDANKLTYLIDRSTVSGVIGNLEFHDVKARNVELPNIVIGSYETTLSDLNSYRARIDFEMISYTDGTVYENYKTCN